MSEPVGRASSLEGAASGGPPGRAPGATRYELDGYVPFKDFRTWTEPPRDIVDPGMKVFPGGSGKVVGDDDRRLVPTPFAPPYRHVCALRMIARDGSPMFGTGLLIGPRAVLTAGHCLFVRKLGAAGDAPREPYEGDVQSVTVVPALDKDFEPFGRAVATRFEVAPEWRRSGDPDHDYGVVFLDGDQFEKVGWFSFGVALAHRLPGVRLNIVGYPVDRDRACRQYYAGRAVRAVRGALMLYETDTYGGQSGSPIWVNVDGERVVVGVHTRTYHHEYMNSGVRIVDSVFEQLKEWKRRAG